MKLSIYVGHEIYRRPEYMWMIFKVSDKVFSLPPLTHFYSLGEISARIHIYLFKKYPTKLRMEGPIRSSFISYYSFN